MVELQWWIVRETLQFVQGGNNKFQQQTPEIVRWIPLDIHLELETLRFVQGGNNMFQLKLIITIWQDHLNYVILRYYDN